MIGDKPNLRSTQLVLPGCGYRLLSGWNYRPSAEWVKLTTHNLGAQKGGYKVVVQAFVDQISFVGSVKRDKVAISVDSDIWPKLSP